ASPQPSPLGEREFPSVLSPHPHPLAGAAAKVASSPRRACWERDRVRGDSETQATPARLQRKALRNGSKRVLSPKGSTRRESLPPLLLSKLAAGFTPFWRRDSTAEWHGSRTRRTAGPIRTFFGPMSAR